MIRWGRELTLVFAAPMLKAFRKLTTRVNAMFAPAAHVRLNAIDPTRVGVIIISEVRP